VQSQEWPHNLENGTQFLDSENMQRNLEIAQIPKLHGTYTTTGRLTSSQWELLQLLGGWNNRRRSNFPPV